MIIDGTVDDGWAKDTSARAERIVEEKYKFQPDVFALHSKAAQWHNWLRGCPTAPDTWFRSRPRLLSVWNLFVFLMTIRVSPGALVFFHIPKTCRFVG